LFILIAAYEAPMVSSFKFLVKPPGILTVFVETQMTQSSAFDMLIVFMGAIDEYC